jgi:D-alanyl-D-alanine carboxypeptidase/D-alanyl-D-alanine-endopeptidase (penicillin-binding protein 4)
MLRRQFRSLSAVGFVLLCLLQPASAQSHPVLAKKAIKPTPLAEQITGILSQPELARAHWGIDVMDLETGVVIYALNPAQLFLPASNAKLFTTAAALAIARPDYRFRTTVEAEGKIDSNGRLQGDLVMVGRGDPNISGRVLPLKTERVPPHTQVLEDMADQVARSGLKMVDGDVIGDDTFYSAQRYAEGWAQDDLQWIDGAPVSALTFNDNVIFVNIAPGEHPGDKALVTTEPETNYYEIENRMVTSAAGIVRKIGVHRGPGSKKIVLWGTLPLGDSGMKAALAVEDPAEFIAQLFRGMLERRGIAIKGKTRARHGEIAQFFDLDPASAAKPAAQCCMAAPVTTPSPQTQAPGCCAAPSEAPLQTTPASLAVLAERFSLPFIEDVRVTNKTSQNLHAELALRLAGKLTGNGGSFEGGSAAVKQFLIQAGLQPDDFVLLDGSGLSRRDLVAPEAVVQLLAYARRQPWGAAYEESLPIAGIDGSLSERFLKSPAAGLVHAKTGTLSHVSALSGYGQTLTGRRFAFSIFCNNHNLPTSKVLAAIDAIVGVLVKDHAKD